MQKYPWQDFKVMVDEYDTSCGPVDSWEAYLLKVSVFTVRARCGREAIGMLSKRIGRGIVSATFV